MQQVNLHSQLFERLFKLTNILKHVSTLGELQLWRVVFSKRKAKQEILDSWDIKRNFLLKNLN